MSTEHGEWSALGSDKSSMSNGVPEIRTFAQALKVCRELLIVMGHVPNDPVAISAFFAGRTIHGHPIDVDEYISYNAEMFGVLRERFLRMQQTLRGNNQHGRT